MVEVVRIPKITWQNQKTRLIAWTGLKQIDSGQAVDMSLFSDKTIHAFGTWGGATMTLYGSSDPRVITDQNAGTLFGVKTASWVITEDSGGANIAFTSDDLSEIIEDPLYLLPVMSGGDGTTNISVIISATKVF